MSNNDIDIFLAKYNVKSEKMQDIRLILVSIHIEEIIVRI